MYFNVRIILPKIAELRNVCASLLPDIVCVVESWLDDNIEDSPEIYTG